MTKADYDKLSQCGRRRLLEWEVSPREARVLELITVLSFDLGQLYACVPLLEDLAEACEVHKADLTRTLQRLADAGAIEERREADARLYTYKVFTNSMPKRKCVAAKVEAGLRARERLLAVNRRRLNGTADANGQERLPMALEEKREDHAAPEMVLKVLLEEALGGGPRMDQSPGAGSVGDHQRPLVTTNQLVATNREIKGSAVGDHQRAGSLVAKGTFAPEAPEIGPSAVGGSENAYVRARVTLNVNNINGPTANVNNVSNVAHVRKRLSPDEAAEDLEGFDAVAADLWRQLIAEMRTGSSEGWDAFMQHYNFWRNETKVSQIHLYNGICAHRLRRDGRLGAYEQPGRVITGEMVRDGWMPPRKRRALAKA